MPTKCRPSKYAFFSFSRDSFSHRWKPCGGCSLPRGHGQPGGCGHGQPFRGGCSSQPFRRHGRGGRTQIWMTISRLAGPAATATTTTGGSSSCSSSGSRGGGNSTASIRWSCLGKWSRRPCILDGYATATVSKSAGSGQCHPRIGGLRAAGPAECTNSAPFRNSHFSRCSHSPGLHSGPASQRPSGGTYRSATATTAIGSSRRCRS